MPGNSVQDVKNPSELESLTSLRGLVVVHFWAPWSQPCRQMNDVMIELAVEHTAVRFLKVEAEEFPDLSLKYEVAAVPTFIFIKGGKVVDRVNGAHVPELTKKTSTHAELLAPPPPSQATPTEDINERLKRLTNSAKCLLFMKGTPQEPQCGFSRQVIGLLDGIGADYSTFNILLDEEVRQGLKKYSNWPTFPQLYVNGELVGGLDILKELKESGELDQLIPRAQLLDDRLKELISREDIMVFMKGSIESPQCGFSRSMCEILKEQRVKFGSFDIQKDEEVRQGLKKFSNWPTYPQLYAHGKLIGGLDIVKELKEAGELEDALK